MQKKGWRHYPIAHGGLYAHLLHCHTRASKSHLQRGTGAELDRALLAQNPLLNKLPCLRVIPKLEPTRRVGATNKEGRSHAGTRSAGHWGAGINDEGRRRAHVARARARRLDRAVGEANHKTLGGARALGEARWQKEAGTHNAREGRRGGVEGGGTWPKGCRGKGQIKGASEEEQRGVSARPT